MLHVKMTINISLFLYIILFFLCFFDAHESSSENNPNGLYARTKNEIAYENRPVLLFQRYYTQSNDNNGAIPA